jgi:anti-sigma regulatory factor (Ser/Thr protein kinase)
MSDATSRLFGPSARDARAARQFAGDVARKLPVDSDAVELVVGELVANAVVHAHSSFVVALCWEDPSFTIEITDADPKMPELRTPAPEGTGGRGLMIVSHLVSGFGARRSSAGGKTVWAVIGPSHSTSSGVQAGRASDIGAFCI